MPTGSIQVYASVAGQAAPLAGVQVAVLDESGVTVARLTTDEAGAAEATNLTAPNASYSLQETNTTVRPYAVYRLRADASGWQSQILDGVQVFDGQQTVARLEFLPGGGDGNALPAREAAPQTVTIPPHVVCGRRRQRPRARGAPARQRAERGGRAPQNHRASGPPGGQRPQRDGELPILYRQCGVQRSLSHLGRPCSLQRSPAPAGQPRLYGGKVGAGDKPLMGTRHHDPLRPRQPHAAGRLVADFAAAALL